MRVKTIGFLLAIAILLSACTSSANESEAARQALVDFFSHLHSGQYVQADGLFGGAYQTLADFNPAIDPQDHVALWENGCRLSGLQCLAVRSAVFKEQVGEAFVFTVEFSNPDGTLFILGPCCGASPTEMPLVSQFEIRVIQASAGNFLVLDTPVYVP